MESTDPLRSLRTAHEGLVVRVRALSAAQYLEPMGGWTPRDVVAHLVGWNRFMIQACRSILAGEPPDYYLDAPNDYANINAALVAHYSSRTRDHLLRELEASVAELTAYVGGLNAGELTARRGGRPSQRRAGDGGEDPAIAGGRLRGARAADRGLVQSRLIARRVLGARPSPDPAVNIASLRRPEMTARRSAGAAVGES